MTTAYRNRLSENQDNLIGVDAQQVFLAQPSAPVIGFDYAQLPESTTLALKQSAAVIRAAQRSAVVNVGNALIEAKKLLGHGQFTTWAEAELGMTLRSAERYMRAAHFLAGKPDTVSLLPARVIYKLAAPSAPPAVVRDVVHAAEVGAKLCPAMILESLDEAALQRQRVKLEEEQQKKKRRMARERARAKAARLEWEEEQRQEQQRTADLTELLCPFVDRLISQLDAADARRLLGICGDWREQKVFRKLLEAKLDEADASADAGATA